jgi:hypothetical protein
LNRRIGGAKRESPQENLVRDPGASPIIVQEIDLTISVVRFLLAGAMLCSLSSAAQDAQPAGAPAASQKPAPTAQGTANDDKNEKDKDKDKNANKDQNSGTSNDRLFYALPNFLTLESGAQVPPLTAKGKFKVVARSSFDYVQIPWYGFLAGVSQAENSEPGYGQGAEGYGKRFGSAFADGTIENLMTGAFLPSLLHQDPRFFQSSEGGFAHRTGYAVSRIFITRTDSGHHQFNFSEIFGSALAAGISTYSYHPHTDKNVDNALSVWGSEVGYDTVTIVVKEFWPDIRRKLSKNKK